MHTTTDELALTQELRALLADIFDVEESTIELDTRFVEDLGVDSLMALEVMVTLEKKYQLKLSQDDLRRISCLRNVQDLLLAQGAGVLLAER